MKFDTVHHVGKMMEEQTRLIIVSFVSWKNRNIVWSNHGKIKQSTVHTDAYITEDFAHPRRAAMIKARGLGMHNPKVIGRYLIILFQ